MLKKFRNLFRKKNRLNWFLKFSMSGREFHQLNFEAFYKGKKLKLVIVTPVKNFFDFGISKAQYSIEGDNRVFTTEKELIKALKPKKEKY